jgi:hypothetical protein
MGETIHEYKVYGESIVKKETIWKIHTQMGGYST